MLKPARKAELQANNQYEANRKQEAKDWKARLKAQKDKRV